MPDIVLKDRNGNDITYPGINSIKVRTTNGDKSTFVHGEMVEKTVDPDFSKGNIEITAAANTFISKVTIEKPKDLLPENIREGEEIGGIVGSAFVVDVVKTAVFEEQEVALTMLEGIPMPFVQMNTDATLAVGETYTVTWNGTEYVCVAAEVDGLVLFGNAMVTGGEDDGVPFACQFVSSELTGGDAQLIIMSMYDTTDVTYTVGISQKTREDVETAEVELALADGDQEVTPSTSDKVLTKVTIKKPESLVPENIAKDVEIAGVVGTMAAGGGAGGVGPCMFTKTGIYLWDFYYNGTQSKTVTVSVTIPLNAVLHTYMSEAEYVRSSSTYGANKSASYSKSRWPTITEGETEKTVSSRHTCSPTSTTYKYAAIMAYAVAVFSVPGIFLYKDEDGAYCIYADETATEFPEAAVPGQTEIAKVDLSNSNITTIPDYAFYISKCREVLMPETVTRVGSFSLYSYSGDDSAVVFDFSKHTTVPTATSLTICNSDAVIKVPAALYDEWIAATNWSSIANQIIAVSE